MDASIGYPAAHFVGNARVVFPAPPGPITEVTTYNRLNDRSAVCDVQYYSRSPASTKDRAAASEVQFTRQDAAQTIDFCFGPPNDPAYPEGVVAALLRGNSPKDAGEQPLTHRSHLSDAECRLAARDWTGLSGTQSRRCIASCHSPIRVRLRSQPAQGIPV